MILYEQPLNERIRTLLRLEHLFAQIHAHLQGDTTAATRAALEALCDIIDIASKADLRQELTKELDRQLSTFRALMASPGVCQDILGKLINDLQTLLTQTTQDPHAFGHELKHHELLSAVRQRRAIPGGACDFDIPEYHLWLSAAAPQRHMVVHRWLAEFNPVAQATQLLLRLIRESATATPQIATAGLFQHALDNNRSYQLIQVKVHDHALFPEISGGKHRFAIRFMRLTDSDGHTAAVTDDLSFELNCCAL